MSFTVPVDLRNIQDGQIMVFNSSNQKFENKFGYEAPEVVATTSKTFYINNITGSNTARGTQSEPLQTFQEALNRSRDSGALCAIFAQSTTPYDLDLASVPNSFNLTCQAETQTDISAIYNQVYDTGIINNVVLESHPYAPYTYCDYSGTTLSIDDLSSSLLRITSGALNGQFIQAIAFQADGKLILRGDQTALVNGDTFEVRRHSVVLNMTSQQVRYNQTLFFNGVELNANGNDLTPYYCKFVFNIAKLRLGTASYRPWSGGFIGFYDSYMSINASGSFNIANNARTIIGSDVQITNSIICGRSSLWGFVSPDLLSDSNLEVSVSCIYWSGADIVVGERLRIHRSLILGSPVQTGAGDCHIIRSFIDQPSFFPTWRQSFFRSVIAVFNEVVWRVNRASSANQAVSTFENCRVCIMSDSSFTVTNSTGSLFVISINSELIFRNGTFTFTGACAQILNISHGSKVINNGALVSTGTTCTHNILLNTLSSQFINNATMTSFQNGSSSVVRDVNRAINYNSTIFGAMISATSNNLDITSGLVPLNNGLVTTLTSNNTFSLLHTNIYITGGSSFNLPATNISYIGKLYRVQNSTGLTITIAVGSAETGRIRNSAGDLVDTVTILNGGSSTFIYTPTVWIQYN